MPKRENPPPPKQSMHGADGLKKRRQSFPWHACTLHSAVHAGWSERVILLYKGIFKNALKRQIILFHLESHGKMSQKVLSFYWEGKMVAFFDGLCLVNLLCSISLSVVHKWRHVGGEGGQPKSDQKWWGEVSQVTKSDLEEGWSAKKWPKVMGEGGWVTTLNNVDCQQSKYWRKKNN